MGRFRRFPVEGGGRPRRKASMGPNKKIDMAIERRLGHLNPICANCNKRNRMGAERCERCGKAELRRSAKHPESTSPDDQGFRGKGHSSSGRY